MQRSPLRLKLEEFKSPFREFPCFAGCIMFVFLLTDSVKKAKCWRKIVDIVGQWPFFHSNEMFKPHQVHRGNLTQILKNLVLKR